MRADDDPAAAPASGPDEETRHVPAQAQREPPAGTSTTEPNAEPEREPELGRRKISWTAIGQVGTVVGAVAAILSVFFTGWATYISAEVAKDQLEQSREESEKEERQQASRVTFWMEAYPNFDSPQTVHLVNRTPDSVTRVMVHVEATAASGGGWHRLTGFAFSVPPCSDLMFKMSDQIANSNARESGVRFVPGFTNIEGLFFADASGVTWIREPDSLSRVRALTEAAAKRKGSFIIQKMKVRRVEPCDEYSSK
ncbi:hypothetical protein OG529_35870 (plasmid) [Streptomyces longwoodensis]|uniref:hypothetical protein n=1 Tax=Streptomyces longwoodensis TaxID=68231 RepID=UPI002F916C5D